MAVPELSDRDFGGAARILNLPLAIASGQPVVFEQLGAGTAISVVVDFGPEPVNSKTFVVSVPGAVVGQNVIVTPSGRMPAGVDFDELEMDALVCAGYASAADTVTFVVTAIPGPVHGSRRFNIQRF